MTCQMQGAGKLGNAHLLKSGVSLAAVPSGTRLDIPAGGLPGWECRRRECSSAERSHQFKGLPVERIRREKTNSGDGRSQLSQRWTRTEGSRVLQRRARPPESGLAVSSIGRGPGRVQPRFQARRARESESVSQRSYG
jgi:hypothetical protein